MLATNGSGIYANVEFIACPARNCCPLMIEKYKIRTKSPIEFRPPKPLLIAIYSPCSFKYTNVL